MNTKPVLSTIAAAALVAVTVFSTDAKAAEDEGKVFQFPGEFSAGFAFTSDYRFRGITQTDEQPAVQGNLDWSLGITDNFGIYAGIWGSNTEFDLESDALESDSDTIELDIYGGLQGTFKDIGWSLGFLYFYYPSESDELNFDFIDLTVGLSYDLPFGVGLGVNYNYSPDNFGDTGDAHFIQGSLSYAIPNKFIDLTLDGSVGFQAIEDNDTFGADDYVTWTIGLTVGLTENVAATVQYVDSDATVPGSGGDDVTGADAAVIGTISASF